MPNLQKKPALSSHLWVIYVLSVILLAVIWYFQWVLGLIMTLFLVVSFYYSVRTERTLLHETEQYISTLSHRVKKVGEEALLEMPFGIILYNEDYLVEWANPYMNQFAEGDDSLAGDSLNQLSEDLIPAINEKKKEVWIEVGGYEFQTAVKSEERLL